ncbi:MAG: hypothetical protein NTZ90_08945 [Proteobacteria bacterium]|nr:hypothetical protein [Pseudomonadota bacterium]
MRDFGITVTAKPAVISGWLLGGLVLVWLGLSTAPLHAAEEEVQSSIEFAPDDPVDVPPQPAGPPPERGDAAKPDSNEPPLLQSRRKYDTKDGNGRPSEHPVLSVRGQNREESVFGAYRIRLSYAIPKFNDGLKGYKTAYGSPSGYPELGADWFAWDWYATLGIGLRGGYYSVNGHAYQRNDGVTKTDPKTFNESDLHIDPNGPTSLTLVPLKLLATAEMTPFRRKWVVLDGWAGYERMYFQEVRKVVAGTTATSTPTTTPTTTTGSGATAAPVDTALVNRGWINSTVVGAAVNILLNPIDQESSYAAHTGMGIGSIYLTGYAEWIRAINRSTLSFGRTVYGIAFTFETSN